ncbi:putative secreted protein [Propionispora sp. 2/2-37]|uniref:[FeFe] hydrogenase, group A n=1 Tax=Propionispora sp. 2/2-37 TaxID=1677858 RepID=UPI0006BB794A|nr:[FeFe] hydrogenase, group A [Propionispora sp. 2/2-37]CUH94820.1 putative secreted protein [Propionispora sp. 2/2-37]
MKQQKVTRRSFLKMMGSAGIVAAGATIAGCGSEAVGGKGWLPTQYNVPASWPVQVKGRVPLDMANLSIERDDTKCILCGQCLEVCRNVMGVYGYYDLPVKREIVCVNCGQCTMWCPTGALTERYDIDRVLAALEDGNTHVVVQTAPATKVSLGEEFGLPPGSMIQEQQVAALKAVGFDAVFDTSFAADLTIMEEASELLERMQNKATLPQFTSCCPGWVKFLEYFYPDLMPHLSSCKSPQQMLGAVVKTYYAQKKHIDPQQIVSVAIMPCTAKKFECRRQEMNTAGRVTGQPVLSDVDIVLTTREFSYILKKKGIDMTQLAGSGYDSILGESSGAGVIFGATGGVTEAAVRTAYYMATGQEPPASLLNWNEVRGLKGGKEGSADIPGLGMLRVAICHGLSNARELLPVVRERKDSWQFIEFMACPGGCIGGGGQPRTSLPPSDDVRRARISSLYKLDSAVPAKRCSYQNQEIQQLYKAWLGKPLSGEAEKVLHTRFVDRSSQLTVKT